MFTLVCLFLCILCFLHIYIVSLMVKQSLYILMQYTHTLVLPVNFSTSNVTPVPKGNNLNATDSNSYHSISLCSIFVKILITRDSIYAIVHICYCPSVCQMGVS